MSIVKAVMDFSTGRVTVELDTEGLEKDIEHAVRDQLQWQMKRQIEATIQTWVEEELLIQKAKIMEQLKPEIAKQLGSVRVTRY